MPIYWRSKPDCSKDSFDNFGQACLKLQLAYSYWRVHFQTSDVVCGSGDRLSLAGFPLVHTSQAYYLHQVGEFTSGLRTSKTVRGSS